MATIKITTGIVNVGSMRADRLDEGTFITIDSDYNVFEVTGGALIGPQVRLYLRAYLGTGENIERAITVSRDREYHVLKPVSFRTETE